MVKYSLLALAFFVLSFTLNSKQNPDQSLIEFYGQSGYENLKTNSPSTFDFQKFYVANGIDIIENVPSSKLSVLESIEDIPLLRNHSAYVTLDDLENFNVLFVNLPKRKLGAYTYKIPNTNMALVIHDQNTLIAKYNQTRR